MDTKYEICSDVIIKSRLQNGGKKMTENAITKNSFYLQKKVTWPVYFYIFRFVTKNPIQHAFEYVRKIIIATKTNKLETT